MLYEKMVQDDKKLSQSLGESLKKLKMDYKAQKKKLRNDYLEMKKIFKAEQKKWIPSRKDERGAKRRDAEFDSILFEMRKSANRKPQEIEAQGVGEKGVYAPTANELKDEYTREDFKRMFEKDENGAFVRLIIPANEKYEALNLIGKLPKDFTVDEVVRMKQYAQYIEGLVSESERKAEGKDENES